LTHKSQDRVVSAAINQQSSDWNKRSNSDSFCHNGQFDTWGKPLRYVESKNHAKMAPIFFCSNLTQLYNHVLVWFVLRIGIKLRLGILDQDLSAFH
jgi:hypothetical protein